jgi:hypothetical protein
MPHVEGRGRKQPVVTHGFTGRGILIRVDDNAAPEFWLAIEYTPEELQKLLEQWREWGTIQDHDGPPGSQRPARP